MYSSTQMYANVKATAVLCTLQKQRHEWISVVCATQVVPWPHPYSQGLFKICVPHHILSIDGTMPHTPTHIIVVRDIIRPNPLHFSLTLKMETEMYVKTFQKLQTQSSHTTENHTITYNRQKNTPLKLLLILFRPAIYS